MFVAKIYDHRKCQQVACRSQALPPRDLGRTPQSRDRNSTGLQGSGHCNKDFAEADSSASRYTLHLRRLQSQRPMASLPATASNCQVLSRGVVHQPRTQSSLCGVHHVVSTVGGSAHVVLLVISQLWQRFEGCLAYFCGSPPFLLLQPSLMLLKS